MNTTQLGDTRRCVSRAAFAVMAPFFLLISLSAQASTYKPPKAVQKWLEERKEEFVPSKIEAAPVKGMTTVWIGLTTLLVSNDGKFYIPGEVVGSGDNKSVFEPARAERRLKVINELKAKAIRFAPENPKHEIFVFTDTDCGYCRMLHQQMESYHKLGIAVNYLAYPRNGDQSPTWKIMESVWCAADPRAALTLAKLGQTIPETTCDNPVRADFNAAQQLGVRGTPSLIFEDGRFFPGFAPADRLLAEITGEIPAPAEPQATEQPAPGAGVEAVSAQ